MTGTGGRKLPASLQRWGVTADALNLDFGRRHESSGPSQPVDGHLLQNMPTAISTGSVHRAQIHTDVRGYSDQFTENGTTREVYCGTKISLKLRTHKMPKRF